MGGGDHDDYDKEGSFRDQLDDFNQTCNKPNVVLWLKLSSSFACFILVLLILSRLRVLKKRATAGDFEAANELLLPVYWWLIVGFCFTYFIEGIYIFVWSVDGDGVECHNGYLLGCTLQSLAAGVELACRRAIIDGVAVFLMHHGAGGRSVTETIYVIIPWCLFVCWAEYLWRMRPVNGNTDPGTHNTNRLDHASFWTAHNTSDNYATISLVFESIYVGVLILFYGLLATVPDHVLYRRPSLGRAFIWWQLITMLLVFLELIGVEVVGFTDSYCLHWFTFTALQVVAGPIILLGTLRNDSKYWQGLLFLDDDPNTSSTHPSQIMSRDYSQSAPQSPHPVDRDVLSRPSQGSSYSALTHANRAVSTPSRVESNGFISEVFNRLRSPSSVHGQGDHGGGAPFPPASPSVTLTQPLLGQTLLTDAAQELATTMEMLSRTPHCSFLHFGLLSIETTLEFDHPSAYVLGAGGAAKVYRGRLRGEPVAIKMIWSLDITADIVAAFREEVMMLAKLARHPSIVQVRGFSIMPPALCVVMELCGKGSLLDILKDFRDEATTPKHHPPHEGSSNRTVSMEGSVRDNSSDVFDEGVSLKSSVHRIDNEAQRLSTSWPERLQMACECAEALAFLHLQTPPVMHKDIKSANYLVVENRHVKAYSKENGTRQRRFEIRLGDLGSAVESLVELSSELGSVRGSSFDMVSPSSRASHYQRHGSGTDTLIVGKKRRGSNPPIKDARGSMGGSDKDGSDRGSTDFGQGTQSKNGSLPSDPSSSNHTDYDESYMYRLNDGVTPNWAAPEVLEAILSIIPKKRPPTLPSSSSSMEEGSAGFEPMFSDPYSCASDVYSLGVVLWEIATCRAPFEDASFMDLVHRIGRKHETPPLFSFIPLKYRALLSACWRSNPSERPSALKVVETLKKIQLELESGVPSPDNEEDDNTPHHATRETKAASEMNQSSMLPSVENHDSAYSSIGLRYSN